jgi:PEP-CTERM motif
MQRPLVIGIVLVALLGMIAFFVLRSDAAPIPEPAALVLLGSGLFACAQARRHLLKKV